MHPLWDNRARTALLAGVLALVLAGVRLSYPEPIWTFLAAALLLGSLARYFFPTSYRLSEQGVDIAFLGRRTMRPWSDFHSYHVGRTGVLLSPFSKPHRLENFRGHYLLLGSHREEVIAFVRAHVNPNPANVGEN